MFFTARTDFSVSERERKGRVWDTLLAGRDLGKKATH